MRIYNIYHDIRKNSIYYRPGNCHHARICVIQKDGISGSILPRAYVLFRKPMQFFSQLLVAIWKAQTHCTFFCAVPSRFPAEFDRPSDCEMHLITSLTVTFTQLDLDCFNGIRTMQKCIMVSWHKIPHNRALQNCITVKLISVNRKHGRQTQQNARQNTPTTSHNALNSIARVSIP